jgi:hypothetical protein
MDPNFFQLGSRIQGSKSSGPGAGSATLLFSVNFGFTKGNLCRVTVWQSWIQELLQACRNRTGTGTTLTILFFHFVLISHFILMG